jgi:hypothetical protein
MSNTSKDTPIIFFENYNTKPNNSVVQCVGYLGSRYLTFANNDPRILPMQG